MGHDSSIWDMTHSLETCLIHMLMGLSMHVRHDSSIWDMTYPYGTWLFHVRHNSSMWELTHPYVHRLAHSYETHLTHMGHDSSIWDVTHSFETWLIHVWHDSFICDMTHLYERRLISRKYNTFSNMRTFARAPTNLWTRCTFKNKPEGGGGAHTEIEVILSHIRAGANKSDMRFKYPATVKVSAGIWIFFPYF